MGESARKGERRTLGKATRERTEKPIGKKREEQGKVRRLGKEAHPKSLLE